MSKLISHFRSQGIVNDSNDKIVELGLQRLKIMMLDIFFALLLGFLLGDLLVGMLFELSYSILRIYAGGFHAPTKGICTWLTYITTFTCILLIFLMPLSSVVMHILFAGSILIILLLSPVESNNKPLSNREKQVYRHKSIAIAAIEAAIYLVLHYNSAFLYAKTIFFALCLVAIGQIADIVSRKITF